MVRYHKHLQLYLSQHLIDQGLLPQHSYHSHLKIHLRQCLVQVVKIQLILDYNHQEMMQ